MADRADSEQLTTQATLEVITSLFELAIVLSSLWIIWGLQTFVDKKSIIVMAFSFRLGYADTPLKTEQTIANIIIIQHAYSDRIPTRQLLESRPRNQSHAPRSQLHLLDADGK